VTGQQLFEVHSLSELSQKQKEIKSLFREKNNQLKSILNQNYEELLDIGEIILQCKGFAA
jgi:hypothetical protein